MGLVLIVGRLALLLGRATLFMLWPRGLRRRLLYQLWNTDILTLTKHYVFLIIQLKILT